ALLPGNLDGLQACVPDLRIERLAQASHWVMHEEPERLNRLIREFIGAENDTFARCHVSHLRALTSVSASRICARAGSSFARVISNGSIARPKGCSARAACHGRNCTRN